MHTSHNSEHLASVIKKNHGINIAGTPSTWQEKCMSLKSAEMKKGECDMTSDLFQRRLADQRYKN